MTQHHQNRDLQVRHVRAQRGPAHLDLLRSEPYSKSRKVESMVSQIFFSERKFKLPSGKLHNYWTWPSRNSEFFQLKIVIFHRLFYVYQRVFQVQTIVQHQEQREISCPSGSTSTACCLRSNLAKSLPWQIRSTIPVEVQGHSVDWFRGNFTGKPHI
jgi:hypothetical protein